MMKKVSFMGMLAGCMLLAASCTNEGLEPTTATDGAQVTFALGLDAKMGSRAATEGMNADKLVYALYDEDGKLVNDLCVKNNAFSAGASENITVSLVKGQTYTVVFWAQNAECDAYTLTTADKTLKVEVDYEGGNNDETRDAFFNTTTFTVEGDEAVEIVLKRPLAQVNLGVTPEDWEAALASGIQIAESKAVIKNAATSINLFDGSVSGETAVTYDFAAVPTTESRATDNVKTLEVNNSSYKWLSMSYILTDESKATLESDGLKFTLKTTDGEEIALEEGLHNVPVQRNWRTNVVGSVLTGKVDFSVTVDPIYYSTATVATVDELKAALADSNIKVIKLEAGEYELVYVHNKGSKKIESADAENPATIKGILAAAAPIEFENVNFDASSAKSNETTGHQYIDRMERKSVVPIYAAKVKFTNCKFTNLYGSNNVVAINYQAHKQGTMLEIDNCYFEGYAYALYSRALVSVTNSTFNQTHTQVNPRAIFLYGLGDGSNGKVVFKNNKATGKTSYTMQMMSSNYDYKNIHFDVQGNENFEVDGEAFLPHPERDFTGCTFAEGSATFSF